MVKLTPSQQELAKSWLYDYIFTPGIPINNPKRKPAFEYYYNRTSIAQWGQEIYNEIKNRTFKDVNRFLNNLSGARFYKTLEGTQFTTPDTTKKAPDVLARYIAWFCSQNGIYWDDTIRTPYELDEFKKTYLGQALEEGGCFASQVQEKTAQTSTISNSAGASANNGPRNPYKSSGPQSGNIKSLIGTPGQKINLTNSDIYTICGKYANNNKPAWLFVTPASSGAQCPLKAGSANGYTDCILYFDNALTADKFLQAGQNLPRVKNGDIVELKVYKYKLDPNGYFKINTDFGEAYIRASKLNENLELDLTEDQKNDTEIIDKGYEIQDIEVFDEAFHKYEY